MTFHEILNLILFNRNKIIKVTFLSTIFLFLILLFLYPRTYSSVATILPPESKPQFGSLSGLLSGQDFSSLLTGGFTNANSQLYAEILKSRSASEFVVKRHNLKEYFDKDTESEAADELSKNLNISINKEGIISLSVDFTSRFIPLLFDDLDTVKNFSAQLTNSFIQALDNINRQKLTSRAKRAREYIEQQLLSTKIELDSAETRLMNFQKTNKTIALPEQINAIIDAASKLKSEIIKTEIEIGLLKTNLTDDSKELQLLIRKLNQLEEQYIKMELGNQDYLLAFKEVPELGRELASLLREVKIQNEVYILLQQQYYKEKIQENRDLPTIEVLDEAIKPVKAASPRLIFSTIIGGIFIFLLMSLIVIISERNTYSFQKSNKSKE